ncbi:hypothetical protein PVL29_011955 [Vitis rotundifolia]|uniref:Uncharacterized protein n=1 Tax=Vitis rotundifolia TaxID=103349 RepID=A0AA38ZRG6_VITRO|nr:hypothetical protein PVL29_011955 [Vitis rotundifolia]
MVSRKPAWEDCSADTLLNWVLQRAAEVPSSVIGLGGAAINCCNTYLYHLHPLISSSAEGEKIPNIIFSRVDLKSAKERRSCRVEKSRVELEELEGICVKSANAVWFQREKRLNCCCLNKYKACNSDSLIRSVGESALTMEILVVNK